MQRNSRGLQQEKRTEASLNEGERVVSPPTRASARRYHPEPPTEPSRRDLSFLYDDQHDQEGLSVAVRREQPRSRHSNRQEFQTDRDVSPELDEAYYAREQSQQKIRELWKTQRLDVIEEDTAARETRRAQFLLDLERAQKEFDYLDERLRQISLARGHRGFLGPYMSGATRTSNAFMPPKTFDHAPSQPGPMPPPRRMPEYVPVPVQYVEPLPRRRNMEFEKEPRISKPSPIVDVHVDPKTRRDVTLHLDMDASEDLEEEFENFSKLRRIGHFNAAKRYFEEHLESFIGNAYVLDQYGQFLLEISDIHTLTKLAREYPPNGVEKVTSANWFFVCERAHLLNDNIYPQGKMQQTPNLRNLLTNWPNLDSTEFQCVINYLRVMKPVGFTEYSEEEYGELYTHLQHEDRLWDFRDLCYGLLSTKTLKATINCLFNKFLPSQSRTAARVTQIIKQHWEGSGGDEVTSLALLDIFTAFAMWAHASAIGRFFASGAGDSLENYDEFRDTKWYLRIAYEYATEVLRQNPLNLKSRPYLQWVVAKVLVDKNTDTVCDGQAAIAKYLSKLRGGAEASKNVFQGLVCFIDTVVYTPLQDEAPNWQPDASITFSHEQEKTLQMVARNARDLGDVLLEAACLQQFQYSSLNPEVYSIDLCNLWHSVGNRTALLRAYLYRYVLKRSPDASNDLRRDLLDFGDCGYLKLEKSRLMILRALTKMPYEKTAYFSRASCINYEPHHNPYNEEMPPPHRDAGAIYSTENNGRQASMHSDEYYSDEYHLVPSDDDIANNNGQLAVRNQRPSSHNFRRPTLKEEETSRKNEPRWFKEQHSPKRILASPFNEVVHAELIPPQPETNVLPITRNSMETSEDFEHGEKKVLASDGRRSTKVSGDGEGIVDLVDDKDKQQHDEERSNDPDVGGSEIESLQPHAQFKEEKQENVQSTASQVEDHKASPALTYENPGGPRPNSC